MRSKAMPSILLLSLLLGSCGGSIEGRSQDALHPAAEESRVRYPEGRGPVLEGHGVESLLKVPGRMRYGEFVWDEEGVPPGRVWVRVDLDRQLLSVFRGRDEIGSSVVLFGADGKAMPRGSFPIRAKLRRHRSSLYDADMPYTLRLTDDGISVHAADIRAGRATHGCVAVPDGFARRMFETVTVGDVVVVV